MKYKLKVLMPWGFCAIFSILIFSPKALALTVSDIANSPKVLADSTSATFPYPTASLVNDSGTIYFVSGSVKVPFSNYKAFIGLGYSSRNVVKGDLSNYNLSPNYVINTASARHPWGSWLSYKKIVYYLSQDGMIAVPSSAVFLSNGGQWKLVVTANKYDVAILKANPSLPVLSNNDSRLISQPVLQFSGGEPTQANPAPLVINPLPVTAAPTSSTTTVASFLPQLVLPANIYASSSNTFTAPSADPNGPLVYTFIWDDGTPSNSLSISSAVHSYYLPGVYMLEVSVLDSLQNTYSTTVPITVILPPNQTPSVPQLTLPSGIIVGQQATVSATASDPQSLNLTYSFAWGDNSAPTVAPTNSATHIYSSSDSFIVTVTATNTKGFSSSAAGYLYVAP